MAKIFISYRRDDSAYATGVIHDRLAQELADCEIFLDVDSIPYGVDFRKHLENSVGACDFLVAVIGKTWLTVTDREGRRRLDHPDDAVRVEVETALHRDIPLIPVFLDNMQVPAADELPEALRDLVTRNAIFVRPPPDFNHDIARLVQALERWLVEKVHGTDPAGSNAVGSDAASSGPPPAHPAGDEAIAPHEPPADVSPPVSAARGQAAAPDPARRPDPQPAVERRAPAPRRRIGLLAAVGLLAALGLGGWWLSLPAPGPPEFEFGDSYLFEDGDPKPANWQAHHHMLGGGFKLPLQYVHWVVHVRHARHMPPAQIPLESRLLDEEGEVVRFSGLVGELPDEKYPKSGQSEWIFSFGPGTKAWKPGKYTLQLSTATKTTDTTFEVFAP